MKILFIYPHLRDGQQRIINARHYFPWGAATVARCLEQDGHDVQVMDIYGRDLLRPEVEEYLDHHTFDCACISSFASMNYSYVLYLAEEIKKRYSVPVITGGLLSDLHYDLLLKHDVIDICVTGEGEITAVDLFRNLNNLASVRGIAYRENSQIKLNPPRELIQNLDTLPMPNFKQWNMDTYLKQNLWADDESTRYEEWPGRLPPMDQLTPNMSFFFGRGCPFRCTFCSRSYQNVRYKSVDRIIEEITTFKKEYGIKALHFYDELVVFRKETTFELCRKMEKLGIYWDCQARVNTVDMDVLHALKDAHCYSIGLGLESGSNKILKVMNKGITREQSLTVLKAAKKVGMHLKLQYMFGYPGETEKDLAETVSLIKKSKYPPRRLSWTTPLPGSEIYDDAKKQGIIEDEEAYIISLSQGMNKPGRILANVSGKSDDEATRLYEKVHKDMEFNYFLHLVWKPKNMFNVSFWGSYSGLLETRSVFSRLVIAVLRKMKPLLLKVLPS